MSNGRKYISSDDRPFTYQHIMLAGDYVEAPYDPWIEGSSGDKPVIGRTKPKVDNGLSLGALKRAKAERRLMKIANAKRREEVKAMPLVPPAEPKEHPSRTMFVGRPKLDHRPSGWNVFSKRVEKKKEL